jgi:hypothetical protein
MKGSYLATTYERLGSLWDISDAVFEKAEALVLNNVVVNENPSLVNKMRSFGAGVDAPVEQAAMVDTLPTAVDANMEFQVYGCMDRPDFMLHKKSSDEFVVEFIDAFQRLVKDTPLGDDDEVKNEAVFPCPSTSLPPEKSLGVLPPLEPTAPPTLAAEREPRIKISLDNVDPANEYQQLPMILSSCFPFVFGSQSVLVQEIVHSLPSRNFTKHLFRQWTMNGARNKHLAMYLFNMVCRMEVNKAANVRFRDLNNASNQAIREKILDPNFMVQLERCKEQPKSDEAVSLVREIHKYVSFINRKVPYSDQERASFRNHIYAMIYYFGLCTMFINMSPDSKGRLCLR